MRIFFSRVLIVTLNLLFGTSLTFANSAQACPVIQGRYADYNCDQKLKLVFIGDSFVKGIRDRNYGGEGGYVKRLTIRFQRARDIEITSIGLPGFTTERILHEIKSGLAGGAKAKYFKTLVDADMVFFDYGRNDYFLDPQPTFDLSVNRIRRTVIAVQDFVQNYGRRVRPFAVVGKMLNTSRRGQRNYIIDFNKVLQVAADRGLIRLEPDFSVLPENVLSWDQLHPSSYGYAVIKERILRYLIGHAQVQLRKLRPDLDRDGIYDRFESRYRCDTGKRDTDGDGLRDGDEVFVLKSNPRDPNSPPPVIEEAPIPEVNTEPGPPPAPPEEPPLIPAQP